MKLIVAAALIALAFTTGFTCSKNTPAPAETPAMTPPPAEVPAATPAEGSTTTTTTTEAAPATGEAAPTPAQ